ncbi:MAG TPA: nucleotidyltransferase domain-containing protein [Thermoanaerobaculia bacterium]|nr:nucleotidyltransferase domain-containing protein [Thermoanaerobaculia bacterium]
MKSPVFLFAAIVPVIEQLNNFVDAAKRVFGDDLRAVVLYGSAAEGRLRATSDVNVIVVLRRFDRAEADALREDFRVAQAAIRLDAMFLLESEIEAAAVEFAQKFADVKRRHTVLYGDDPFAALEIPREAIVRRLRQTLLNLVLRLRAKYIERSLREEQAALTVADAAGPLRAAAAAILELEGAPSASPKEALETVVRQLGRDDLQALLPHLSEAREQRALPAGQAAQTLYLTIELARALADRARRL